MLGRRVVDYCGMYFVFGWIEWEDPTISPKEG
jgi:hypothetical protein